MTEEMADIHPDTQRLNWLLDHRAVVIDGHVYEGCDFKSGVLWAATSAYHKGIDEMRRMAIDAAMRASAA